jgi:hypothetical protein
LSTTPVIRDLPINAPLDGNGLCRNQALLAMHDLDGVDPCIEVSDP